jgi:hypothetical protein
MPPAIFGVTTIRQIHCHAAVDGIYTNSQQQQQHYWQYNDVLRIIHEFMALTGNLLP